MKGYTTFSEQNIVLNVSQNSTVDVKMTVGSESQTVTVTADQPLLDSEKSDRGLVLSQRSVEEALARGRRSGHTRMLAVLRALQ